MADNYVQIRIKATDTAKPDLDDLRADLDELGSKVDTAKVDVDDEDAKRKLLEINAGLAELNKRVANPKIDTAGAARAESRVEKLKHDFQDLIDKTDESNKSSHGLGLINKLLFGAEGAGEGGGGEGGGGGLAGLLPDGMMLPVIAAIVPAAEAALVEVTGLVSGFAAAGAGAGAFALLAAPAFEKVKGAINDTHKQLMKLNPDERGAVYGIRDLEHSLDRMSKAFEPAAFKVFNEGLRIANQLLPLAKPFADTFATSLDGLLKQVSKFAGSTGFKDWIKQFHSLEGPAVHAIGEGLGKVGVAIGHLLTVMSKKDVVHAINIAFDILAGTIDFLVYAVSGLMRSWDQLSSAFRRSRHDIAAVGHDIASTFDRIRHDVAAAMDWVAHRVEQDVDHMRTNLHNWADDVARDVTRVEHWFQQLPGRIEHWMSSLPGMLHSLGVRAMEDLLSGLASLVGRIETDASNWAHDIANFLGGPFGIHFSEPSQATKMITAGRNIALGLATGMDSGRGALSAAAGRVSGAAMPGLGGGRGGGGAGGGLVVEIHAPSGAAAMLPPQFWTQLANGIRVRGGDPAMLQRKVAFR